MDKYCYNIIIVLLAF